MLVLFYLYISVLWTAYKRDAKYSNETLKVLDICNSKYVSEFGYKFMMKIKHLSTLKEWLQPIGTSEMLVTSIIKQNWRQQSIGVQVQNIQIFPITDRKPI